MTNQQATRRQTIEQERGRQAWLNVRSIKKDHGSLQKEYRSLAQGLNAMIQINGLGQTLGFLNAKSTTKGKVDISKPHYHLLKHLTNWMYGEDHGLPHFKVSNKDAMSGDDGLLKWVIDSNTSSFDYRRATTECLAFGTWLRRFAEAELEEGENG
jgi:CRISPR-associated protein Cmr5